MEAHYATTHDPADLDEEIALRSRAVHSVADDHQERVRLIANLVLTLTTGASVGRTASAAPLSDLLARATAGTVFDRIRAGYALGALATAAGEQELAVDVLDDAVRLLPSAPPREGRWTDQENQLGLLSGHVVEVVAAHCAVDDPGGVLAVAELGRGVLLGARLDLRTDLTDLAAVHPDLAERFRLVRDRVAVMADAGSRPATDVVDRTRHRARGDPGPAELPGLPAPTTLGAAAPHRCRWSHRAGQRGCGTCRCGRAHCRGRAPADPVARPDRSGRHGRRAAIGRRQRRRRSTAGRTRSDAGLAVGGADRTGARRGPPPRKGQAVVVDADRCIGAPADARDRRGAQPRRLVVHADAEGASATPHQPTTRRSRCTGPR